MKLFAKVDGGWSKHRLNLTTTVISGSEVHAVKRKWKHEANEQLLREIVFDFGDEGGKSLLKRANKISRKQPVTSICTSNLEAAVRSSLQDSAASAAGHGAGRGTKSSSSRITAISDRSEKHTCRGITLPRGVTYNNGVLKSMTQKQIIINEKKISVIMRKYYHPKGKPIDVVNDHIRSATEDVNLWKGMSSKELMSEDQIHNMEKKSRKTIWKEGGFSPNLRRKINNILYQLK